LVAIARSVVKRRRRDEPEIDRRDVEAAEERIAED
jgi:hypothetical protein